MQRTHCVQILKLTDHHFPDILSSQNNNGMCIRIRSYGIVPKKKVDQWKIYAYGEVKKMEQS